MSKRILLGVDAPMSLLHSMHCVWLVIHRAGFSRVDLVLLHIIPSLTSHPLPWHLCRANTNIIGYGRAAHTSGTHPAQGEHRIAEASIASDSIETLIRLGVPAEGIVRGAKDLHADLIVVGSQGNTLKQRLRRIFAGSISRKVLQLAPCPVMIVTSPHIKQPSDLVAWYEEPLRAICKNTPTA